MPQPQSGVNYYPPPYPQPAGYPPPAAGYAPPAGGYAPQQHPPVITQPISGQGQYGPPAGKLSYIALLGISFPMTYSLVLRLFRWLDGITRPSPC